MIAALFVETNGAALGMVTFVDAEKTKRKRDPGRCFRKAGWTPCGMTKGGLFAFQIRPADMPALEPPIMLDAVLS